MAKKKASGPTKKTAKKTKTARKAPARVGRAKPAKKVTKAAPKEVKFFGARKNGARGEPRKQFHVLLTAEEHAQLAKLTHKMQLSAADVVRSLLSSAKA